MKLDNEKQMSHDITYMWNLKTKDTNELIAERKQTHRFCEQTYGYQRRQVQGDELGILEWHMHTAVCRPTGTCSIPQGTLPSILW